MDMRRASAEIPVVLLYNVNHTWSQQDIQECTAATHRLAEALIEMGHPIHEVCIHSQELEQALIDFDPDRFVIFNWCEELPGVANSEAQVAQILERLGYTFTGSSARALAFGQDKPSVKRMLQNSQVQLPVWQVYSAGITDHWDHFPAIVKLAYEHCSYGITRESVVQSMEELASRVRYVDREFRQPALVEEFIDGREFHVGVIGNEDIRVFPPAEIDYSFFADIHDRLCTYESNFNKESLAYQHTQPIIPAQLTKIQLAELEELVIRAYRSTDCRDYARMDIRLRDGEFFLLDVNPNPDISADTSMVRCAELMGLSYGKLGNMMISLAAQRHPKFTSIFDKIL
jgi:D-alanine-D-alanine ligase